jgi:hypothetical protein
MQVSLSGTPLPNGTMICREYELLLQDEERVAISVTLSNLWDESDGAVRARAIGAQAFGYVIVSCGARRLPPMRWSWDGADIKIVEQHAGARLAEAIREAIASSVLHFFASMENEDPDPPPVLH